MNIRLKLLLGLLLFSTLAFGLYLLPKSVVSKGLSEKKSEEVSEADRHPETLHKISPELAEEIQKIKSAINTNPNPAGKANGFVELAGIFKKASQFDSAADCYERAMSIDASLNLGFEAGSAVFDGLPFIPSPTKLEERAEKARKLLESVPSSNPNFAEAQAKASLTWVNSASPMKGILKLRELSETFPENKFIAFQLGLLSFQSGQYEKAADRFQKVLSLDEHDVPSHFYLASSLLQTGKRAEALAEAKSGLKLASDMEMKASFEDLIKQIEK